MDKPEARGDEIRVNLAETMDHLEALYVAYTEAPAQTDAANWAACVQTLVTVKQTWLSSGWISKGAFKDALVLLAHRRPSTTIPPSATEASLLLTLTTSIKSRQQKSVWARALQEVLDGHIDPNRAAAMGVKAVGAAIAKRQRVEAKRQAERTAMVSHSRLGRSSPQPLERRRAPKTPPE